MRLAGYYDAKNVGVDDIYCMLCIVLALLRFHDYVLILPCRQTLKK